MGIYIYRINTETIEQHASELMNEKLRQLELLDLRLKQKREGASRDSLMCACAKGAEEKL
jgi:hypothetical protein